MEKPLSIQEHYEKLSQQFEAQLRFIKLHFGGDDMFFSYVPLCCRPTTRHAEFHTKIVDVESEKEKAKNKNWKVRLLGGGEKECIPPAEPKFGPNGEKTTMRLKRNSIYTYGYLLSSEINELAYSDGCESNTPNVNDSKILQSVLRKLQYLGCKRDYYIGSNGYKTTQNRTSENLFCLHNIVLDIDCHDKNVSDIERDHAIASLRYYLLYNYDGWKPNHIVYTGRGVQLWFALKPASNELVKVFKAVAINLIKKIEEMVLSVPSISGILQIDKSASLNPAGLFRMPGSYNTAVRKFGSVDFVHDELLDLMEYYTEARKEWEEKNGKKIVSRRKRNINAKIIRQFDPDVFLTNRVAAIKKLIKIRGGVSVGQRTVYCLILHSAYMSAGKTEYEAWEAVLELNAGFDVPLHENELRSSMSSSRKKKYKFSDKKMIELLDISDVELKKLKLNAGITKREKQRMRKREKKADRNRTIIELHLAGYTQKEIADKVQCSQSTISRVIAKHMSDDNIVNIDEYKKTLPEMSSHAKEDKQSVNFAADENNAEEFMPVKDYSYETTDEDTDAAAMNDSFDNTSAKRYSQETSNTDTRTQTDNYLQSFEMCTYKEKLCRMWEVNHTIGASSHGPPLERSG